MRLTTLIEHLQATLEQHGDLDVEFMTSSAAEEWHAEPLEWEEFSIDPIEGVITL